MKKKLRTSLLAMNVLLVVLLSAVLALSGFEIYRSDMISRYQNYAGDVVSFLAREIDGDDLQACIETKTKACYVIGLIISCATAFLITGVFVHDKDTAMLRTIANPARHGRPALWILKELY